MEKTQILIADTREGVDLDKKSTARGFCPYLCAVDHPLWDVWMENTQILIVDQREGVDLDKKSTARGFCPYFCAVDHPLWDV